MSDQATNAPRKRVPLSIVLPFSTMTLPTAAMGLAVAVYLPPYLGSHLAVSLAVIGGAFASVRLLDIGVDPLLGLMMDRTRTPFGRYRLWLVGGAPILALALYQLFMAPKGIGASYLIVWLLVMYLGSSIVGLAHAAWSATLVTDYHDRSRVFGLQAAIGVAGALAVILIPILGPHYGRSAARSVQDMGWFMLALIPASLLMTVWRTPEPIAPDLKTQSFGLRDYWDLIRRPDLIRLFLCQMALTLGPGWMAALYLFFFRDFLRFTTGQASILLGVYILAGIVGAPSTARLAMRLGKHRTLMITTTAYSLGLCTVGLIPKGEVLWAIPGMLWCGAFASGFDLMTRAMMADVGDEVRLEQGKERISLLYALTTLASKIASAFSIGLTFPLLQRLGYVAKEGAVNTPAAIHSLMLAFLIGPIGFVMLGGACVVGWRLNAKRHNEVRNLLEARDAAFGEESMVESLTGQPAVVLAPTPDRH